MSIATEGLVGLDFSPIKAPQIGATDMFILASYSLIPVTRRSRMEAQATRRSHCIAFSCVQRVGPGVLHVASRTQPLFSASDTTSLRI
jgi:hypothetical protein